MTKEATGDFYAGIISALAVIALHDQETIFREIVDLCDEGELIAHARKNDEMEFSGLSKYGYGRRKHRRQAL